MKFIILTLKNGNKCFIDYNLIAFAGSDGKNTIIFYAEKESIEVKETPEEIIELISKNEPL